MELGVIETRAQSNFLTVTSSTSNLYEADKSLDSSVDISTSAFMFD